MTPPGEEGADGCESGVFDPLAGESARPPSAASIGESGRTDEQSASSSGDKSGGQPSPPLFEFWTPSQLRAYEPPEGQNIIGDYHIQRGAMSVLAGPPGCGKSRAALWLAIQGARGEGEWLGFPVHCQFRTLILQNENGLGRLHRDFEELKLPADADKWIRVSSPPSMGLNLANPQMRNALKEIVRSFAPHLIIIDPWNALARDAMEKDYQESFGHLRDVLAASPENPACLIVHHVRKPKSEDKHRGRSLANLLAGSYTIISVPRSVLLLQPASDDTTDNRVVVTPTKNNDGELGERSAWKRSGGGFSPCPDFNWEEYDGGERKPKEAKVREEHLRELFDNGRRWLKRSDAMRELEELADVGRNAAYNALKTTEDGRFSTILCERKDKRIGLAASATDDNGEA